MGKRKTNKKIRFFSTHTHIHTHIYIIYRWFNTLFQRWFHCMGLSRWWKHLLQRNFSQILKCTEWVRQCLAPECGTNPNWYCARRKVRKAMKDGMRRGWEGTNGQQSSSTLPVFSEVLHLRKTIKPLHKNSVALLSTTKRGLWLLSK